MNGRSSGFCKVLYIVLLTMGCGQDDQPTAMQLDSAKPSADSADQAETELSAAHACNLAVEYLQTKALSDSTLASLSHLPWDRCVLVETDSPLKWPIGIGRVSHDKALLRVTHEELMSSAGDCMLGLRLDLLNLNLDTARESELPSLIDPPNLVVGILPFNCDTGRNDSWVVAFRVDRNERQWSVRVVYVMS